MAENRFYDYATGKEVKSNPEETYRQLFEHILIDDLGYPKDNINIEVVLQRGSNRNAEEVDIVVYSSNIHRQENAYIIIEIETPKKNMICRRFHMLQLLQLRTACGLAVLKRIVKDHSITIVTCRKTQQILFLFRRYHDTGKHKKL